MQGMQRIYVENKRGLLLDHIALDNLENFVHVKWFGQKGIRTQFFGPLFMGVCLGHQSIAYAFGAKIIRADRLMHGKTSEIQHDGKTIFEGLQNPFVATRYHSLIIKPDSLPDEFVTTARTVDSPNNEIMGIRHKSMPLEGVQFHPESFLTDEGHKLLTNFLKM